eukprot:g21677.t2
MCHTFASRLRDLLEVHVLAETLLSAAELSFRYVREVLQVAPADIIVMGRSMGAAAALFLAEKFYFGGLVLIAPFLSLRDALGQYIGAKVSEMMLNEMFCNKDRIKHVKVPTLVIHGRKDRLIDCSQGQQLFETCPSRKKLFVCPEEMGHNDDLLSDPEFLMRPILRFFPLPDYYFTELRVPKEWLDVAPLLFQDGVESLLELLPDPLDWRALQCACRWRRWHAPGLLEQVHHAPKLRMAIKSICQKLRRLPLDDLMGERIRTSNLTDVEVRYLVEIFGAEPRNARAEMLDLSDSMGLAASQGFALGCWLPRFQGHSLRLAECKDFLRSPGIGSILRGVRHSQLPLRLLDLCAAQLSKPEAPALAQLCALKRMPSLETLNLSFNEQLMTGDALEGMARALEGETCGISHLVLKHCDVSGKAGEPLGRWLRHLPCLRELNLNWNPEIFSSRGLRGLLKGLTSGSGGHAALPHLQVLHLQTDNATAAHEWVGLEEAGRGEAFQHRFDEPEALQNFRRSCPSLHEAPTAPSGTRFAARHALAPAQENLCVALLSVMRLPPFRQQLRLWLSDPLDWRALQLACRWSCEGSRLLQQVHRRPGLRALVAQQCQRLRRTARGDLLRSGFGLEELRGTGARPASGTGRASEILKLDLSYQHLPPGGVGRWLRNKGWLWASSCDIALAWRSFVWKAMRSFVHQQLESLSLAGNRKLCSAAGLRDLLQSWARGSEFDIPVKELSLKNCGLDADAAVALGELMRRCHGLQALDLQGNQALAQAPALAALLQGVGDEGFPKLSHLIMGFWEMPKASEQAPGAGLRRPGDPASASEKSSEFAKVFEAFDKCLCPLYHGVVESTKNDQPLAKEDILPDSPARWLDTVHSPMLESGRPGEADSESLGSSAVKPGFSEDLTGLDGVDLDIGILKYLRSGELFKAGYGSFSQAWQAAIVPTSPFDAGPVQSVNDEHDAV